MTHVEEGNFVCRAVGQLIFLRLVGEHKRIAIHVLMVLLQFQSWRSAVQYRHRSKSLGIGPKHQPRRGRSCFVNSPEHVVSGTESNSMSHKKATFRKPNERLVKAPFHKCERHHSSAAACFFHHSPPIQNGHQHHGGCAKERSIIHNDQGSNDDKSSAPSPNVCRNDDCVVNSLNGVSVESISPELLD
jgi:hypothetical protein